MRGTLPLRRQEERGEPAADRSYHARLSHKSDARGTALIGRNINNSEHRTFVRYLRTVADGPVEPAEACRTYHEDLGQAGCAWRARRQPHPQQRASSQTTPVGGRLTVRNARGEVRRPAG